MSVYLQPVLLLPHVLQLSSLLRLQHLDFGLQMTERHRNNSDTELLHTMCLIPE